ncbi:RHS repeat-associated core domain-containing protein [Burkholderia stabilis]|uniref:RHS repeat-associated core domain-containing protein n=1 Tax=Burkholderia stabilis TaxID=95485 RepID=A0A4Q2A818_9BURK|nr:RHS repeat-associated core domain-containing protein [Burkholderia stabilis]RXV65328.1 RHS repeat-associated core domain-containing protein [Burkholderia stabilis]
MEARWVVVTALLATDQQRTVLAACNATSIFPFVYTVYGYVYRSQGGRMLSRLGFNGECLEPVTGHYLLGHGYRIYDPCLMRFHSPDTMSPLGSGGINSYAYCSGDPINSVDPSGHIGISFRALARVVRALGIRRTKLLAIVKPTRRLPSPGRSMGAQAAAPSSRPALREPASSGFVRNSRSDDRNTGIATIFRRETSGHSSTQPISRPVHEPSAANVSVTGIRRDSRGSISSLSSRDSTPPGSRSSSPLRDNDLPYFVQSAIDVRRSSYWSRRFE